MRKPRLIFLLLFFVAATQFLQARVPVPGNSFATSPFFIEGAYGRGMVNNHYTQNAVFLNAGYRQFVATARFCRSGIFPAQYIFENAFLAGYRFDPAKQFRLTFSAGYSDLAFEKAGSHPEGNYNPALFTKSNGLSFETEAEWMIPIHGRPSAWSVTAMYYSTFNGQQNLNGFAAGLKISPQRFRTSVFQSRADSVEVEEAGEPLQEIKTPFLPAGEAFSARNYIRIGITGLIYEPHVSYSRFRNEKRGFTITGGYRVYSLLLGMEFSIDPDLYLHGPAAYYSYDFLKKGKKDRTFVLSMMGGLRSLHFDRQWVGYGGTDDEPNWNISRSRQDLVLLGRMGFMHLRPFAQSIFIDAGPRFSYYKTTFYGNRNIGLNSPADAQFSWPENGFHIGMEVHLKIEIGGAW